MTLAERLRVIQCLVAVNDDVEAWAAADEMRHYWRREGFVYTAQQIGHKLHAAESRGLVESRREDWGKMWRLSSELRRILAGS